MKYRGYQKEAENNCFKIWETKRSALICAFTGSGKTKMYCDIAERMHKATEKKIMLVADREELITQASDRFSEFAGLDCEIEMAANYARESLFNEYQVVVATIQTLYQDYRLNRFDPNEYCLLIFDEAHKSLSSTFLKVKDYFYQNPDLKLLGATATPQRSDEKALGKIYDEVALNIGISDGIEKGWLVECEQQVVEIEHMDLSDCRSDSDDFIVKDLNQILEQEKVLHEMIVPTLEIAQDRQTLIFVSSVEQSKLMCEIINRYNPGIAEHVDGKTPKPVRRDIVDRYRKGELQILINVGCFCEGFDSWRVEVIANCRPTKSRILYEQIFGRMMRPASEIAYTLNTFADDDNEGRRNLIANSVKPKALMIDMVGNAGRHKLITATDILGGNYDDEVVELASENAKRKGKPENVMTELQRAEHEIAERHRKAELAKAKEKIKFNGKYFTRTVSPFDALDITPKRIPGFIKTNAMTDKQRALLERWGIPNVDQIQNTLHASQIIEAAPPSSGQLYRLRQAKLPIEKINRLKANAIISIMAKKNWTLTDGNREYIYREIINKK